MVGAAGAGTATSVGMSETTTLSISQFPRSVLVVLKQNLPKLLFPVRIVVPSEPVALA